MIDELLVKKAVKGDAGAFLALTKKHHNGLYRTAYGMLGNEHDAADALQESLLKAYRDMGKLRDPQMFKSWMYRILTNRCIDIIRQRQRTTPVENVWGSDSAEHLDNSWDAKMDVSRALEELDEQHRTVVVLRFFQDMSLNDISVVLNCPVGTVKSRLHRALQKMKSALSDGHVRGDTIDMC